ncbi:MAG TPA: hypothetical protein VE954_20330 [Oligoflexus sp.]|uniref:hypothetical protein n=1 Tax=Oligoflexus sp. TaxID=1971216 RepID=UPI002D6E20DF|nr:hypothetical protein [Oligoflexus sp.]HYX35449.1 hypothetical protein [Oligoflexus sp.]
MSDSPLIIDPSARFVDEQHEDLVDFIFRLTGDRSRSGVMAKEVCRQMKDELQSQIEEPEIRARLFQLAYEFNEEAMRPIPRDFFEAWFRYHHKDPKSVAKAYRWEIKLLELGHHAAQLLLLRYRYGFSLPACAFIVYREEVDVHAELEILEGLIHEDRGLDYQDLATLPRYGFLQIPEHQTTALSHIMNQLRPRQRWWPQLALVLAFSMLALFFWMLHAFVGFRQIWRLLRSLILG